ncbi:hypothetical protein BH24PSE2_BH24PSE2_04000 [soil metagenome]
MPARLTVFYPHSPARHFYLNPRRDYVIGRGNDCDLCLHDERLSRRHACLKYQSETWELEDLGSKNGTFIDGRPVQKRTLTADTWISFSGLMASFNDVSEQIRLAEEHEAAARWESSVALSRRLDPAEGLQQVLNRLLDSVLALSTADRGYVLLQSANGDIRIMGSRLPNPRLLTETDFSGSRGAVELAMRERRPVVTCDAAEDALLAHRPSIVDESIRALVCLPLAIGNRALGAIYVDSRTAGKVFSELDLEVLSALANHAALVIGVSSLRNDIAGIADLLPEDVEQRLVSNSRLIALLRDRFFKVPRRARETPPERRLPRAGDYGA